MKYPGMSGGNEERLGPSDRKSMLHKCVLSNWQARWDASENRWVTYEVIPDVSFGVNPSPVNRPDIAFNLSVGFLLTGHGSLNALLDNRHLTNSPECQFGIHMDIRMDIRRIE